MGTSKTFPSNCSYSQETTFLFHHSFTFAGGTALRLLASAHTSIFKIPKRATRYIAHHIEDREKNPNPSAFTKSCKLEVTEDFYRTAEHMIPGSVWYTEQAVTSVGTSTFLVVNSLREKATGSVLASLNLWEVRVNLDTRQSDPIPQSVRQRLPVEVLSRKPPKYSIKFDIPIDTTLLCSYFVRVNQSFIDRNGHMNLFVYHQIILKIVQDALEKGKLFKGRKKNCMKEFGTVHNGEAVVGETLKLDVWEASFDTVHAVFSKAGQKIVIGRLLFHRSKSQASISKLSSL